MDHQANAQTWPPETSATRRAPRFNVISVVAPILGFVCGFVVFEVLNDHFGWWAGRAVEAGIHTLGWFVVLGLLCALVAIVRVEKWWALTAVGLVLNGAVVALYWLNDYSIWPGLWPEP